MKLKVLGCGGGIGGERRTMALLLDNDVLIDAGSGVGNLSLEAMAKIGHVFLTHCHLDHTAFLPLLADATAFLRQRPLEVHALPETIAMLRENMLNGKLWPDYSVLPSVDSPYIRFHPLRVGQPVTLGHRVITPLPAQHAVPALGYRLDSGVASWVYSGDTTFHAPFWEALSIMENLKYLMVEVTFLNASRQAAERSGHMTAELLLKGLKMLRQPVSLLIAHMESGREEETMAEVRTVAEAWQPRAIQPGEEFEF
jgi:ribonuclease BN (tRNA processing enzyme)